MNAWAAFFFRNPLRAWYVTTRHLTRSNSPSPIWQLQRENVSIGTLFARGCENIRASSTLRPRCHEYSKKGKGLKGEMEITSGRRQRFDEWEGGLNKQLVIRSPHIYGNKGSLLGDECLASFECSHEIRFGSWFQSVIISYLMCLHPFFEGKTKEWKISIGDTVRGIIGIWSIFLDSFGYLENLCHVSSSIVLLSYIYIDKNDLIIWNNI